MLELSVAGASGGLASRVFNNFKNKDADRMIGDRRLMNAGERHICGPSKMLPAGYMITSIHCPRGSILRGIVTDRKDFYHQARVTRARAESNALPFSFDAGSFKDDEAFDRLRRHLDGLSGPRHLVGDMYGKPKEKKRRGVLLTEDTKVFPCFASLFQGDHLGVEFALSSHCSLLADYGLLKIENKIRNHAAFPLGPVWEGLVIDDYFAISCQPNPPRIAVDRGVWTSLTLPLVPMRMMVCLARQKKTSLVAGILLSLVLKLTVAKQLFQGGLFWLDLLWQRD